MKLPWLIFTSQAQPPPPFGSPVIDIHRFDSTTGPGQSEGALAESAHNNYAWCMEQEVESSCMELTYLVEYSLDSVVTLTSTVIPFNCDLTLKTVTTK